VGDRQRRRALSGTGKTHHTTRPNLGYKPRLPRKATSPVAPIRLAAGPAHRDVPGDGAGGNPGSSASTTKVATAGQAEIDIPIRLAGGKDRRTSCSGFKYIVKNVALRNGKTVTFMPPSRSSATNGSGDAHPINRYGRAGKAALRPARATPGMSKDGAPLHRWGAQARPAPLAALCQTRPPTRTSGWSRDSRRR